MSVRQNDTPSDAEVLRVLPGGRFEARRIQLMGLIRFAYGFERLDPRLVAQGPSWMYTERFDIFALNPSGWSVEPSAATHPPELRPMLRTLLAEHFDARVRVAPQRTSVQVLHAVDPARPGPGLRPARGGCVRESPDAVPQELEIPRCHERISRRMQGGGIDAASVTMADVARLIAQLLPSEDLVIDGTGWPGAFDVTLEIDGSAGARSGLSNQYANEVRWAVREQLGLTLEGTRALVEMLIVDRARRPAQR